MFSCCTTTSHYYCLSSCRSAVHVSRGLEIASIVRPLLLRLRSRFNDRQTTLGWLRNLTATAVHLDSSNFQLLPREEGLWGSISPLEPRDWAVCDATVRGPTPLMGHLSFLIEALALRHIDSLTHFIIKPGHVKWSVSQPLGGTGWHWVRLSESRPVGVWQCEVAQLAGSSLEGA